MADIEDQLEQKAWAERNGLEWPIPTTGAVNPRDTPIGYEDPEPLDWRVLAACGLMAIIACVGLWVVYT